MPRTKPGKRLYLTADKSQLVAEGDARAAFLFCTEVDEVDQAEYDALRKASGGDPPKHVLLTLNAKDAVEHVEAIATLEALRAAEEAEAQQPKGARKSVLEAIEARLDELTKPQS